MNKNIGHYATLYSRAVLGVQAPEVQVEVHSTNGLPSLSLVGMPETSVKEGRDRVRSALLSSGFALPPKRITINLAPADTPKQGGRYDLAIALGILQATGQISEPSFPFDHFEFLGELSLDGSLRAVPGILPAVIQAKSQQRTLIIPKSNLAEASLINDAPVFAAEHLLEVCQFFMTGQPLISPVGVTPSAPCYTQDMSDIRGQQQAKRVLEMCASGGHSLLMVGPPGAGKSMLAARLLTILPELSLPQAIEVASIRSVAGESVEADQFFHRHLVQPHHTATAASMVGGGSGSQPKPGAISMAHHSILFLDELPEFSRSVLEALREPLETGHVEITRVNQKIRFPANVQLICAMNPSPSGFFADDEQGRCQDTPEQIQKYLRKISGPLLDRIDCHLEVPAVNFEALSAQPTQTAETSAMVRERVIHCQRRQMERQGCLNAHLTVKQLESLVALDTAAQALLKQAVDRLGLSARGYHRLLRVSRTLADMANQTDVSVQNLAEAISYRSIDVASR